jgi:hypothetical protein
MYLEVILLLIVLVPIILLSVLRTRKDGKTNLALLLCQIIGNFTLVLGIILLFPSFYLLFYGKDGSLRFLLPMISLALVGGGNLMTNWAGRKLKAP